MEMEEYLLGKIIENWMIEIHIILKQIEGAREELRKSLTKRKEIAIQQNDTQYKEVDTKGLLDNGKTSVNSEAIIKLLEKNSSLRK